MTEIIQIITDFFSIKNVLFTFMGQSISALELISTITGLSCVFLAVRGKVANFWVGYLYNILLFCLFLQIRTYSSMLLQPISLAINLFGHYRWTHPKKGEENEKKKLKVTIFNNGQRAVVLAAILVFMFIWGYFLSRVDVWCPKLCPNAAAMPYFDAFVLGTVLMAQYLSAQRKLDCWGCWLIANISNIILFLRAGLGIMPFVYAAYILLAVGGAMMWYKEYKKQNGGASAGA